MLVAELQTWPQGDREKARTEGFVLVGNDETGTEEHGNYDVVVTDAKGNPQRQARIERCPRKRVPKLDLMGFAVAASYASEVYYVFIDDEQVVMRPVSEPDLRMVETLRRAGVLSE